jgi:hypothetical protein
MERPPCRTSADDRHTMAIDFAIEQGEGRFGPKRVVLLRGFRAEGMRSAGGGDAGPTPAGSAAWSPPSARSAPRHRSCTTTTISISARQKGNTPKGRVPTDFRPSAGAAAHPPGRTITISIRCAYELRKSGLPLGHHATTSSPTDEAGRYDVLTLEVATLWNPSSRSPRAARSTSTRRRGCAIACANTCTSADASCSTRPRSPIVDRRAPPS